MQYALSFSGGKDSMLALDRAVNAGLDVRYLFNIFEGSSNRVRFHGVPAALIEAQATAVCIPLIQDHTHPDDYETVLLRVFDRLRNEGIGGIIFGNIHLADIRAWYEERTTARGFQHVEPLWGEEGTALVAEVVRRGYVARLVSIDTARTPMGWLGRVLDEGLVREVAAHPDVDPCGERGEYHTFVSDGPLFRHPVETEIAGQIEMEGHALIDLRAASTRDAAPDPSPPC